MQGRAEESSNSTAKIQVLYKDLAINFRLMMDTILLKNDFVQRVISCYPHNKRNQAATWPAGFTDIAALQRKDPTPKFKTKYCTTSATYEEMLLINFGGLIHMFLPLWKNPKEDSGESLTGVLIAVKERLMEYDDRERALAAVKTS
jgi:hypothetical protein